MRTAFIETLEKLAGQDKNLWLLTGDLGFSVLENFSSKFPNQYLNMGVAEQNMVGVAAGLALSGKKVFVYSIIPFLTLRPLEHIRNDVCMQNANVKLVGVGAGFAYGQLGLTHHAIEDIAVIRSLPNINVVCPGDPWEVEMATTAIYLSKTPAYLRLGKKGESILHKRVTNFTIGKGIIMHEGQDGTIIATGSMLETATVVYQELQSAGLKFRLISMHTVKPLDEKLILDSANMTDAIFTLEEHNVMGGLGEAVALVFAKYALRAKFLCFSVNDRFTKVSGTQEYLREINGLSVVDIVKKIIKKISEK